MLVRINVYFCTVEHTVCTDSQLPAQGFPGGFSLKVLLLEKQKY